MTTTIADYDTPGYDYRTYWADRAYEQWAEDHALRRLVPRLGHGTWFIDFGGGYGRNAVHYRHRYARYVVADYSATNLTNAMDLLRDDVDAGRAFGVRCDVSALPFADAAFDCGMVIRVLHHLPDVHRALLEMGRVVGQRWLLDVPIKHHVLAMLRGLCEGRAGRVRDAEPVRTGTTSEPFWNFQLAAVRRSLHQAGWRSGVAASVNNLRRWDHSALPAPLVRILAPGVRLTEAVVQRGGRGWWGPNQFVLAQRYRPVPATATAAGRTDGAPALASRMICPACRGALSWSPQLAACAACERRYPQATAGYWDFTMP